MSRQPYPSDATDAQWALIEPLIPPARPGGRPRTTPMREVTNALLYVAREGCSWRAIPHDFGIPWKTAYNYFRDWQVDGTWDRMVSALRGKARVKAGRNPTPSAGCIDSQSAKTAHGGEEVGTDGGKKVRGRKRHVITDTLGLLLAVVVTAANVDDGAAAPGAIAELHADEFPRLEVLFGDGKYRNHALDDYLGREWPGLRVEVRTKPEGKPGFEPLPIRWVVEQSLGCLGRWRRLARDYEKTTPSSEAFVKVAAIHRMARRLAPRQPSEKFHYKRPEPKRAHSNL